MLPEKRHSLPRWELTREGQIVGWIQEIQIGRATRHFFKATGIDPENGNHVNLETSTNFDDRVQAVNNFQNHPEQSAHRHSGIMRSDPPGASTHGRLG